jgi:hypothetical protein
MIRLINQDQMLDEGFRKKVIEQIKSPANEARKREMKKRYEVYKDLTVKWVIQKLEDEGLKDKTLKLMTNRASNISICRKIVNKLARCYQGGVIRDTGSPILNSMLDEIAEHLDMNNNQVKIDRYKRLFKNVWSATLPEVQNIDSDMPVYKLSHKVFSPWQYDVVELAKNHSKEGIVILSDYQETSLNKLPVSGSTQLSARKAADGYAESENNDDAQVYIWWSDKYHFTTDSKGNILRALSPEDNLNPIQQMPGVTYAEDQEGCYWSSGGDDLVDGSILVNTLITDMNAIAFIQGWGQYVVTGKKIPAVLEGGPHSALVFTYDDGEPEPKVQVINANPPLDQWMKLIEQYVALLLSTNDCSPGSVSMRLDPSAYPSGIAMLIEKSEANNSIDSSRKQFMKGEREQFAITKAWHNYLLERGQLDEEWTELGPIPEEMNFSLKFSESKEVISEKEKLETIKLRKELGLNTEVDLIKIDNPDMSDEDAIEKLKAIKAGKIEAAASEAEGVVEEAAEQLEGEPNTEE